MTQYPNAANHGSLTEATIAFVHFCRWNGLNVSVQDSKDALQTAAYGIFLDPDEFRYALKALFCTSEEEATTFDVLFSNFWIDYGRTPKGKTVFKNQSNLQKKQPASLVMMGFGDQQNAKEEEEARNVSGANKVERLRKTDFSKVAEVDTELLEELAMKLWKQMSKRLKRRMRAAQTQGRIDLRKTIRSNIGSGGELIDLKRKKRTPRKQRLIILLDVSGSMDKYSFFLLRFIWALREHFERVEAFIFSTKLIRISNFLELPNLVATLSVLSAKANNWSSGTQIGKCFKDFNEQFAKQVLVGQSTLIVLSDGLDTGDPEELGLELAKMKRRTRRLIWLNPLKGMKGYQPLARGMAAAMPEIDVFRSAHNLDSLLELENYLSHV